MFDFLHQLDWSSFYQHFHFLRPRWLYLLIPAGVLVLVWYFLRRVQNQVGRGLFSKPIMAHLLLDRLKNKRWQKMLPGLVLFVLIMWVLVMAGPSWQKQDLPAFRDKSALIVVLDLSYSMNATDQLPSRLALAKRKIQDMLAIVDNEVGLVAYSGSAHLVVPLTYDDANVLQILKTLTTKAMPVYGSAVNNALAVAANALVSGKIAANQGQILLLTDGVTTDDVKRVMKLSIQYPVSVLMIGGRKPFSIQLGADAKLPASVRGTKKDVALDQKQIEVFANVLGAKVHPYTFDNQDLSFLLEKLDAKIGLDENKKASQWEDSGKWFVWGLVLMLLFLFRRGYLLGLVFVVPLYLPQPLYALELLETDDQTAQRYYQQGAYDRAAKRFSSKSHQADAYYRLGDYQRAESGFKAKRGTEGYYNLGNAYAKQGKVEAAIEAYKDALTLSPDHTDAAHNKQLLERWKKQQQDQQNSQSNAQHKQSNDQPQHQPKNPPDSKPSLQKDLSDQKKDSPKDPSSNKNQPKNQPKPLSNKQNDSKQGQKNKQQQDQQNSQSSDQKKSQSNPQQKDQSNAQHKQSNDQPQHQPKNPPKQKQAQQPNTQPSQLNKQALDQAKVGRSLDNFKDEKSKQMNQDFRRITTDPSGYIRRRLEYEHRQQNKVMESFKW